MGKKAKQFREKVSRKREPISKGHKALLWKAVIKEINHYIPRNYLKGEGIHLKDILEKIELDVVQAASAKNSFADGGRLEDARVTFNLICDNNWSVPKRSLENLDILSWNEYDRDANNLAEPLFWFSFQLFLNLMVKHHGWDIIYHRPFIFRVPFGLKQVGEEFLP